MKLHTTGSGNQFNWRIEMVEDLLTSLKKYELRMEYKSLDFNPSTPKFKKYILSTF